MPGKRSKNGRPDNFAAAVTEVSERMSVLVREEIELAKAEVSQKANSIARGAAAIAAGAVFGVFAVIFGLLAIAWAINDALNALWPGFVIVFAGLLALTIGAFMFARSKLGVGAPAPTMAIDEAKKIRETVAASTNGKAEPTPAIAQAKPEAANGKAEPAQTEAEAKPETGDGKAEPAQTEAEAQN